MIRTRRRGLVILASATVVAAVTASACGAGGDRTPSSVPRTSTASGSTGASGLSSALLPTATATATATAATSASAEARQRMAARRAPSRAGVPPVSAAAKRAGLLDVRSIVPDAIVDLRYATKDNFTHVRLYPADARCLVHKSMARGLRTAAARLRTHKVRLVFWDCYRPHSVQVRMYQVVSNPNWVAKPGPYARSHEAGRSVDVTLARKVACPSSRTVHGWCRLAMGTGFDNFTPRAFAYARKGVSARAEHNRALLRGAMRAGGITVYSGEWWHFDGPGSSTPRPHLKVPL